LGHPVVIEQKYFLGDKDFRRQLRIINESGADGIVIWGDSGPAATILQQMREVGMKQRVFGSFRVLGDDLLKIAGDAAEGLEIVYPFDPTRDDPAWLAFKNRFAKRFERQPEVFASLAYDTMNILLQAICRAGLSRGLIRDALAGLETYKGVTSEMVFDPNSKNIVPMYLGTVHGGKVEFRRYSMQKPYMKISENPPYNGPSLRDAPAGPLRIGLFGPQADKIAATLAPVLARYGGRYSVAVVASDVPWGKASSELVRLIYDERVLGLIATDRDSSHLAEQLAVKAFLPVVAISSDRALTSVNIPWIFRLAPETSVAEALARTLDAAEKAGPNRGRLREILARTP
jgi:branched-chain amino acid transport system substrate-binding protein